MHFYTIFKVDSFGHKKLFVDRNYACSCGKWLQKVAWIPIAFYTAASVV